MQPEGGHQSEKRLNNSDVMRNGSGGFLKGDSDCSLQLLEGDLGKWTLYYFCFKGDLD